MNGAVSRICEPTCACRPRMVSFGLRSIRAINSAAAAGARPNLEPSCPVRTCACTSAVTPGNHPHEHVLAAPGGHQLLEPVDVVGAVDDDQPDAALDRQR